MDRRFEAMDMRFDAMDSRFDDFEQRMIHSMGQTAIALGEEVGRQIRASHQQLRTELGAEITQQLRASEERTRDYIRGLDDQYRDLSKRVAALEEHTGIKQ
jgi:hypothetical protein